MILHRHLIGSVLRFLNIRAVLHLICFVHSKSGRHIGHLDVGEKYRVNREQRQKEKIVNEIRVEKETWQKAPFQFEQYGHCVMLKQGLLA